MKITKKDFALAKERIDKLEKALNGGKGSGNFGHSGRPGEVGGSRKSGKIEGMTNKELEDSAKEYRARAAQSKQGDKRRRQTRQDILFDEAMALRMETELKRRKKDDDESKTDKTKKDSNKKESKKTTNPSLKGKSLYEKVHMIEPGDEVHIKPKSNLPNFDKKIVVDYIQDGTIHYGSSERSDGYTYPAWAIDDITKIVRKKKSNSLSDLAKKLNDLKKAIAKNESKKVADRVLRPEELAKKFENGGKGSGNFGHFGRPGQVGGSASAGSAERALGKGISDRMRESGGFTVDAKGNFYDLGKAKGYAVGGFGTEGSCSVEDWNNTSKKNKFLRNYIKENAGALIKEGNCLGGWISDGKVYLDVSRVFDNRKDATIAAMKTDQDSITDFKQKPGSGKEWPDTKDLVKEYGLQDEYKKYKGIRKKERAEQEKKAKERDDDPLKDIPF